MTDEEVEVVAEELAKIGGASWHPGRQQGPLMRVVTDRYRDQARAAIAALDRFRASREQFCPQDGHGQTPQEPIAEPPSLPTANLVRPGAIVTYRPPSDRRAYTCRVVEIQGSRAYLEPILRTCTGWISIEYLQPATEQISDKKEDPH